MAALFFLSERTLEEIRRLSHNIGHVSTITEHPHIVTDSQIAGGEPIIKGTRITVRDVVEIWRLGTAAEEIPRSLPHLTLGQVFDALGYYSDHQQEISACIERNRVPEELIDPLFSTSSSS